MELQRLFGKNIVFAGTQDFLTDEGEPIWEFDYMTEEEDEGEDPLSHLRIDPVTRDWMYNGTLLHFRGKEHSMFLLLRKNFGMALSKDELAAVAWTPEKQELINVDENIQTHISNIRGKLEAVTPFTIELMRSKSYRMTYTSQAKNEPKNF
jgi:DNA-binding response OmpR family regulator